ncbi:MAG: Ig-like domain-containing protein [Coriobacteriia bacterium]|nr:Ig-like domain-containing protein [Coriobacteriia bacterium]
MFRSSIRRTVLTAMMLCALLATSVSIAHAGPQDMDFPPLPGIEGIITSPGDTTTNPLYPWGPFANATITLPLAEDSGPGYELSWWRDGWGSSLFPHYSLFRAFGESNAHALGLIYTVDRFPGTVIDTSTPEAYYQLGATPNVSDRFTPLYLDIRGIYAGGPATPPVPGANLGYEGRWFLHYVWYDSGRFANTTIHIPLGIDVTPPAPVSKLVARPYKAYTGATGPNVWFAEERCDIQWENKQYDSLSGTGIYEIWVNGVLHDSRLWSLGHTYTNVTLEDDVIKPGSNKIDIVAVDRAGNRSLPTTTYFKSDPDEPTISILTPKRDSLVPRTSTFAVDAKDLGGVRNVRFFIDGKLVHTATKAPYSVPLNLATYANGKHTFSATVTDMFGRQASASTTFNLDKTPVAISNVSFGPNPFYPIIREGYKDNMVVNFRLSEPASMQLIVRSPDNEVWATRSGSRAAGAASMVWDGAGPDGFVAPVNATYTWRLRAADRAGNVTWSPTYSVLIRNYELIRVAPNAVRVVAR